MQKEISWIVYLQVSLHVVKDKANVGFVSKGIKELQKRQKIMMLYNVTYIQYNNTSAKTQELWYDIYMIFTP